MNTVQRFKQRKIVKAQLGTLLKKGWDWFKNSNQVAAIAESPAVMTASGWRVDRNGKAKQDQQNTKETKQLRNNLATIGEAGVTAPTMVGDVVGLYNVVRHPVQTGKVVWKTGQDVLWFLRNPRATKVYHGTPNKEFTNLNQAKIASRDNVGVHVTPKREIAQSPGFMRGKDAHILEAWIPRHNTTSIDIGSNDYRLFQNNYIFDSRPKNSGSYWDVAGNDEFRFKWLEESGANPSINNDKMNTENRVVLNLRNKIFPKIDQKEADNILKRASIEYRGLKTSKEIDEKALELNTAAANLMSKNGYKVVKYNNVNPVEGNGGISYFITDPKVFYHPQKYNWNQMLKNGINYTKYPLLYETNK